MIPSRHQQHLTQPQLQSHAPRCQPSAPVRAALVLSRPQRRSLAGIAAVAGLVALVLLLSPASTPPAAAQLPTTTPPLVSWTQLTPATSPEARSGHAMAYDA